MRICNRWYRLETAKRRLLYSLRRLNLPLGGKNADPAMDLRFEFLADSPNPAGEKVLTGHSDGRITINVAEADDAQREQRRLALHEPYRTVLGHFRHEIGHHYWDRLIAESEWLEPFRAACADTFAELRLFPRKGIACSSFNPAKSADARCGKSCLLWSGGRAMDAGEINTVLISLTIGRSICRK